MQGWKLGRCCRTSRGMCSRGLGENTRASGFTPVHLFFQTRTSLFSDPYILFLHTRTSCLTPAHPDPLSALVSATQSTKLLPCKLKHPQSFHNDGRQTSSASRDPPVSPLCGSSSGRGPTPSSRPDYPTIAISFLCYLQRQKPP